MNKQILQKINNLAKFIFDESKYNKLNKLLISGELNSARLLIDDQLEEIDLERCITPDDAEILSQYKQCDELLDIVIDLLVNGERAYEEGEQIKQAVRQ